MIGRASKNSLGYKDKGYGKTRLLQGAASPAAAIPGGSHRSCPIYTNRKGRQGLTRFFVCLLGKLMHPTVSGM